MLGLCLAAEYNTYVVSLSLSRALKVRERASEEVSLDFFFDEHTRATGEILDTPDFKKKGGNKKKK